MWFKTLMVVVGLACILDRTFNGSDAWSTGLSPSGESLLYIMLGVVLILLGLFVPKQVVHDVF